MKIVVLDGRTMGASDNPWTPLTDLGDVAVHDSTAPAQLLERAKDADVLLTNKTPLNGETIAALPNLKLIATMSTGYNIVDIEVAAKRGIPVCNVPGYSTPAVVQHTMALMLELASAVCLHARAVRDGKWCNIKDFCFWERPLVELAGKTLGVVGFGDIGGGVGAAASALGMHVAAYAPRPKPKPAYGPFEFVDLDELLRRSDVVSLHCPLTPENEGMINAERIALMKPTALLINTARGQLVNEADLAAALKDGRIGGAGLDTVTAEPMRTDNPLMDAPNCVVTPHIAWATRESRVRLMERAADNVRAFLAGSPTNVVNGVS